MKVSAPFGPVAAYLQSKESLWKPTSLESARFKLEKCYRISEKLDPREIFEGLKADGLKLYSIQVYMMIAAGFETGTRGTYRIRNFLRENSYAFRNAYQEKTKRLTTEHLNEILKECRLNPKMYNAIILMAKCGLRRAEVFSVKWSDIEFNTLRVTGKGGKKRLVPILTSWLLPLNMDFIVGDLQYQAMRRFISKHLKDFTPHDFRAYYATEVANNPELGVKNAQMLLGHESLVTTQRYVRADFEKAKQVLLKLK